MHESFLFNLLRVTSTTVLKWAVLPPGCRYTPPVVKVSLCYITSIQTLSKLHLEHLHVFSSFKSSLSDTFRSWFTYNDTPIIIPIGQLIHTGIFTEYGREIRRCITSDFTYNNNIIFQTFYIGKEFTPMFRKFSDIHMKNTDFRCIIFGHVYEMYIIIFTVYQFTQRKAVYQNIFEVIL